MCGSIYTYISPNPLKNHVSYYPHFPEQKTSTEQVRSEVQIIPILQHRLDINCAQDTKPREDDQKLDPNLTLESPN
jgi:hypothetical protein